MSRVVVMGVSGAGKSAVGERLAAALGVPFLEGDALHDPAAVEQMRRGIPLTDADRAPWLDRIGEWLAARPDAVVACSALKRAYRDRLRGYAPDLVLVHLTGDRDLLRSRLAGRRGHFMPASLLDSQLADLEPPQDAITLDVRVPVDALVAELRERWA